MYQGICIANCESNAPQSLPKGTRIGLLSLELKEITNDTDTIANVKWNKTVKKKERMESSLQVKLSWVPLRINLGTGFVYVIKLTKWGNLYALSSFID